MTSTGSTAIHSDMALYGSLYKADVAIIIRFGDAEAKELLAEWPVERPKNWHWRVNRAETKEELELVRQSVNRSQPFGSDAWVQRAVERLGLVSTIRPRGRPRKQSLRNGS